MSGSRSLAVVLLLSLSISRLFAQAESGTVVGTVTDQVGAAIPSASVVVTHDATKFSHTVIANTSGQYVANLFPSGTLTITVEQPGFERLVRTGIQLTAADTLTVDLRLVLGNVQQTVEVTGEATLVQSQSAAVSTLVTNQQVVETPLNGRSFVQLIPLMPGASPTSSVMSAAVGAYAGQRTNVSVAVNGSLPNNNSYLIDGIYNKDMWVNYLVLVPSVDSIQEVRVLSSNYTAEYGAAAGATTVVQSKSGGNQYHGDAFEFLRNDAMDANTYFNNAGGAPRPPFRRNEFGGTMGGPIRKNKTFIFGDYQGTRIRQPTNSVQTIPTLAQRQAIATGNFGGVVTTPLYDPYSLNSAGIRTAYPGNVIPVSELDPLAAKLSSLLPAPSNSAATRNFLFSPENAETDDQFDIRVDQNLSGSDRIFFKFSRLGTYGVSAGSLPAAPNAPVNVGAFLTGGIVTTLGNWTTGINYVKTIGASIVNEVRLGLIRPRYDDTLAQGSQAPIAQELGVPGINISDRTGGLPGYGITGYATIGNTAQFPDENHTLTYQYEDVLNIVKGSHSLKMGGRYLRHDFNGFTVQSARGSYTFSGQYTRQAGAGSGGSALADFALGAFNGVTRSVQYGVFGMRMWESGLFIEDSWRVSNRLTITYGLRHEMQAPPYEVNNRWANFNINTGIYDQAGVNGASRSLVRLDTNNFAPRAGLTYLLTKDGKTVLRGGGGFFYVESWNMGKELHQNAPMTVGQTVTTDQNAPPPFTISAGLPLPPAPTLTNRTTLNTGYTLEYDPSIRLPKVLQWSLGVQREITPSLLLDVSYVGTRGLDLLNSINANQPVPGPGDFNPRRPLYSMDPLLGDVDLRTNFGASKYQSMQVSLRKRLTKGLSGGLAYTYSHNLSNTRGPAASTRPENSYCSACDWGNAGEDRRQTLVFNHVYELPFGAGREHVNKGVLSYIIGNWDLTGVWTFYTGQWASPSLSASVSNATTTSGNVTATERPNWISNPNLPSSQRTINAWFNVAAFAIPAQYTFGNAGVGIIEGPGFFNADVGIHRDFRIKERFKLTYRWEMFNAFNRANFSLPAASIGNATAGTISGTSPARIMQMALKLNF
jgi:Carboxypeptidase regulatory-like domain